MEVEWSDWRADVAAALRCLALDPPHLEGDERDPRWPDLTNAVHWLVDDTGWDQSNPRDAVGLLLHDEREATAIQQVVSALLAVAERNGPAVPDRLWFADEAWSQVQALAAQAEKEFRE